jgi:hypothetical protein
MMGSRYWGCAAIALAVAVSAEGCITKGDTNIDGGNGSTSTSGGSLCAQYCTKVKNQGCNLNPNCEANCTQNAQACIDAGSRAADIFLECVISDPMTCGSTGDPDSPTCRDEWDAAQECMTNDSNVCAAAAEPCAGTSDCCDGNTCVNFPDLGGSYCTAQCDTGNDCYSGCCAELESGGGACAPEDYCQSTGTALIGDVCTSSDVCATDYCEFLDTGTGYCSDDCVTSSDCGQDSYGVPGVCWYGTCGPGCNVNADCSPYGVGGWACYFDTGMGESYCIPGDWV